MEVLDRFSNSVSEIQRRARPLPTEHTLPRPTTYSSLTEPRSPNPISLHPPSYSSIPAPEAPVKPNNRNTTFIGVLHAPIHCGPLSTCHATHTTSTACLPIRVTFRRPHTYKVHMAAESTLRECKVSLPLDPRDSLSLCACILF